ncbi:MAG TPA: MEDS domain-containing protein [Vicinamibacterales bacterium]|nr:MEDS domain-containing protein [Vicinamibacterales bacterium]
MNKTAAYPHAVKFYHDEHSLARTVAEFIAPGLQNREPAIVIATPEHRRVIAAELTLRHVNVAQRERSGDLQMVDTDALLNRFMVGTEPDPLAFHATIDELIARACKDRSPCPVRAYGELVDVLWKRANAAAAIQLEVLWNQVAIQSQFSLLCGYAVGNFFKEISNGPTFQTVCDQHNHIIPEDRSA